MEKYNFPTEERNPQYDIIIALSHVTTLKDASSIILDVLMAQDEIDACGFYAHDAEDNVLSLVYQRNLSEQFIERTLEYDMSRNSWNKAILSKQEPLFSYYPDMLDTYDVEHHFAGIGDSFRAVAIVPIIHETALLGSLNVSSKTVDAFSDKTKLFILEMAFGISKTMHRIFVEDKIASKSMDLDMILNMTSSIYLVCDFSGKMISCNRATTEKLGYTHEEIQTMCIPDVYPPERRDEVLHTMHCIRAGTQAFCNIPLITKQGRLLEVTTQVSVTKWCGKDALVGISYDIGEMAAMQSDVLAHWLSLENMLCNITDKISDECSEWESEQIFAMLGNGLGVDRVYLFRFRDNLTKMDNTIEWCKPGVEAQITNLQDIDTAAFPWWMTKLKTERIINIANVGLLPPEASTVKEILEGQNIKSILVVPIIVEGGLWGYIGFDQTSYIRYWKDENVRIIKIISKIFENSLHKKMLTDVLIVRNEALQRKNYELEKFTRSLFHDIQTPLVSIYSYAESIKECANRHGNEEMNQLVEIMEKKCDEGIH